MYERFTDQARRATVLAEEEARTLGHNSIGTEHLLLGLIREDDGVVTQILGNLGISIEDVRSRVEQLIDAGRQAPSGHLPFAPGAKKVFELSHREALQLGHNWIGVEHLLLALLREGKGVAAQALTGLGAELNKVRQLVSQRTSPSAASGLDAYPSPRDRSSLPTEIADLLDENEKLHEEVARLRTVLRNHGIDPDA